MNATIKSLIRKIVSPVPFADALVNHVAYFKDWIVWRWQRPNYPSGKHLHLHLGCGDVDHPGFVNIDARPRRHIHHVQGIGNLSNFANNSVDLLYGSHCLEHFSHLQTESVLREWHRVVRPGGIIRLSVPDFDLLLKIYQETGRDIRSITGPLMGGQDYQYNFHYTCFNYAEICRLLTTVGFKNPRRWIFGSEHFTSIPDHSGRPYTFSGIDFPVSLNVEATK